MSAFKRLHQLSLAAKAAAERAGDNARALHKIRVEGLVFDHNQLTSGRVPTKALRKMGHPFGRQGGAGSATGMRGIQGDAKRFQGIGKKGQISAKGVLSPLPINRQKGKLRQRFFVQDRKNETRMGYRANPANAVLSPTGTSKMVARGFYSHTPDGLTNPGELRKRDRARVKGIRLAGRNI
jgi:hypothetical protein